MFAVVHLGRGHRGVRARRAPTCRSPWCFLAIAGAADVITAIFRSTILQLSAPDELRGRLSSIHILVVTGGPRLGDLEAGLVAQWFNSATFSVVSGGLICIVGAIGVALGYPEFRRYRRTDPSLGAPGGAPGRAPTEP